MTEPARTHKFVTIEQVVRAEQPDTTDLPALFKTWGLTNSTQEALWAIALDNMEGLKTVTEIARGGFHDVLVYPANILAAVLTAHTDRFYIAHNHPSGSVAPTEHDMELTRNVMDAANVAGMSFEDHIITGPEGWFSFFDEGLLTRAKGLGRRAVLKKTRRKASSIRVADQEIEYAEYPDEASDRAILRDMFVQRAKEKFRKRTGRPMSIGDIERMRRVILGGEAEFRDRIGRPMNVDEFESMLKGLPS